MQIIESEKSAQALECLGEWRSDTTLPFWLIVSSFLPIAIRLLN